MLKTRLIPVLLLKNGVLVRSKKFSIHQTTGDPINQVERFTDWKADELIYLDISREGSHDYRDTMHVIGSTSSKKDLDATTTEGFSDVLEIVSKKCRIPLTVGGGIKTIDDIRLRLKNGADKISINTAAVETPELITEGAEKFGNQCIVVSIDVKDNKVFTKFGKEDTGLDPVNWAREVEKKGAGEILLNSIDRDGLGTGYDIGLIQSVVDAVSIPVIALGGVGSFDHLVEGVINGHASAVAAANIFHFTELSVINAKKHMAENGVHVRL